MFVTLIGAVFATLSIFSTTAGHGFIFQLSLWLWFTVLFANFAEAVAEGRGKAQADSLRNARKDTMARLLSNGEERLVPATVLEKGDTVVCEAGDVIPSDGEVIEGIASVDEAAITGESAPVIRESGGDRSAVTGGTRVISDRIVIRITSDKGNTFLDRVIAMVEGARRQKTPNEIALTILLSALTMIFLLVCVTLMPFGMYAGVDFPTPVLIALLVCLIPTTIGGLLSAIGISGIDRLIRRNVVATSGRAVEAAGDIDVLLLDKTGTITIGNRMASDFRPAPGVTEQELAGAAQLASLADATPEGRSIVVLAKERFNIRGREVAKPHTNFVPFSAQTRMSGVDLDGRSIRKGAAESIKAHVEENGGRFLKEVAKSVEGASRAGRTPLVVCDGVKVLGVVELKDVVKGGIKERFAQLRRMGIKTVMNTGTQAAREAGNMVDLDSNPTKLIEIVEIGKQLLMTRGSLTTFSIANDVAKYFAIIPAMLMATFPAIAPLNVMRLANPQSAILSAVIFNALIIIALIPLALKGVAYRPAGAAAVLQRNLLVYGLGGLVAPFLGIKVIDIIITVLHLV